MFRKVASDAPRALPARRVLISGAPNTLKTTALLTWPRPMAYLALPGEKGHETIPNSTPGLTKFIWEVDEQTKTAPGAIVAEVETLTKEILVGKHGQFRTLALDGLHKLYGYYFHRARLALLAVSQDPDEEKIVGRAYGQAHDHFGLYLTLPLQSPMEYVVATIWEGTTRDDPENRAKNAPTHIFPDLPGQMARRVVGEFGAVLYSTVSLPDPKGQIKGEWQIRPQGKVWGVGVKVDPEIAKTLPAKLLPDFAVLERLLSGVRSGDPTKLDQKEKG